MKPHKKRKPNSSTSRVSDSPLHEQNMERTDNSSSSESAESSMSLGLDDFVELQRTVGNSGTSQVMNDFSQNQTFGQGNPEVSMPLRPADILYLQRTIGNNATAQTMSNILHSPSSEGEHQKVKRKKSVQSYAQQEWDDAVDSLIEKIEQEYYEVLSVEQLEHYLEENCGIENPCSNYFEMDNMDEYEAFLSELQSVDIDELYNYYFESEEDNEEEVNDVSIEEKKDEYPPSDIRQVLNKVNVMVLTNRGRELEVNLGAYFGFPKKHSHITMLSVSQEIENLMIMEETSSDPDPDRLTAFYWATQELYIAPLKKGSGGGGGNLSVMMNSDNTIIVSGRPGFQKNAIDLPGMKKGYHRRHIVAWHTLSKSVQHLINRLLTLQVKDEGISNAIKVLQQFIEKIQTNEKEQEQTDTSTDLIVSKKKGNKKSKVKDPLPMEPTTDAKDLCTLVEYILSKLNSNILNLWPGDGYENSLINTYQSMFRLWAKECLVLDDDKIDSWKKTKQKDIQNRVNSKKGKYADVIQQFSTLLAAWRPRKVSKLKLTKSQQLSDFLLMCADSFEVDFPSSVDREGFEAGQQISNHILGLAGTLLQWADNDQDTFNGKTLSELSISFETILNEFMFPPESSKLGKSEATASKHKGTTKEKEKTGDSSKKNNSVKVKSNKVWDREQLKGTGVPNAGNTCYIASVMQLINTISRYRDLFVNNVKEDVYNNEIYEVIKTGRELLNGITTLTTSLGQITAFRNALIGSGWLGGHMEDAGNQQDAAELMTFILGLLGNTERTGRLHQWQDRGSAGGVGGVEHTVDPIVNLSGIRYEGEGRTIEDLLQHNLNPTRIESEQLNPNTVRDHRWSLEGTLPNILTFQLNRFSFSTILGRALKLKEKVSTGLTLNIPAALSPNGNIVGYQLSSFIVHSGNSAGSGHYVSYVRRHDGWYLCDDATISKVSDEEVNEMVKESYIVTYEKL